jgi:hypothetical protein
MIVAGPLACYQGLLGRGMKVKKFICAVLLSLIVLIGCVATDGPYQSVGFQRPEYEGTGVEDPSPPVRE